MGIIGGHYGVRATALKVLHTGLWWPTLHNDATDYAWTCNVCQCTGKPLQRDEMPLVPQVTLQPFDKWVVDFVGPIKPLGKRNGARYIITLTYYLMRLVEVAPVVDCTVATTARFLFDNIVT